MIHLADGCSIREATAGFKQGHLADISDVALLKKLRVSSEWFRWMSPELLVRRGLHFDDFVKSPDSSACTSSFVIAAY